MNKPAQISRREFLGKTAGIGAAGVAALNLRPAQVFALSEQTSPNDKIRLGVIGVGNRGTQLLEEFLKAHDVVVTAICDVWREHREAALAQCEGTAKGFHDHRELLDSDNVDAVVIATPPHWHTLVAIDACEAGKDFYLEKPMTMSVGESLAVRNAVRKHNPITQIGTQIHAGSNYRRVVDIIRSGILGKITKVRTLNVMNQGENGIGNTPNGEPPDGLDWNRWCGPAPIRPFNPLIVKKAHEHGSFMDYSGGWTPGMAPHVIDLPYWALELDHPISISSSGGRYVIQDAGDAYDTHEVLWQYPDFTMTWSTSLVNAYGMESGKGTGEARRNLGIAFHGVGGTLITDYESHDIFPEGDRTLNTEEISKVTADSPGHHREWLDCLRTREQPSCQIGYHYKIDVAINLSLVALKLGRSVRFDPQAETIPDDPEAAELIKRPYRDPWKFPEAYL